MAKKVPMETKVSMPTKFPMATKLPMETKSTIHTTGSAPLQSYKSKTGCDAQKHLMK
jgi:hypothetical protein